MRTRYAIINEEKRTWFEKKWHLPHGYSDTFITFDFAEAIDQLNNYNPYTRNYLSIERIDDYGREIVYRGYQEDESEYEELIS